MSRPRVLLFSLAYWPFIGGAEVAVQELTARLAGHFDFDLITLNLDGRQLAQEQVGNVRVFRLNGAKKSSRIAKIFFPWRAFNLATNLQRENNYQLVWSVMANQAGIAGAFFKKRYPDIPFLLTLQEGDDLNSLAYNLRLLWPRFFGVFRAANHIQAISHYLANWARDKMGATCPVTVIPNGVDVNRFQLLASSEREKLGKAEKIVITTSRLVYKNGVDILLKALALLPGDVKLWIVGAGPEKASLMNLAESLGLAARVSFLGQVASSDVGRYLAQAAIFARPARSEGLGNSFLEAMAAGLPVIGTPVGGIPDFLKQRETGWLAEVDKPASVAAQIKFILAPENQETVVRITNNAKNLVRENYDWAKLAVRFDELFSGLLS